MLNQKKQRQKWAVSGIVLVVVKDHAEEFVLTDVLIVALDHVMGPAKVIAWERVKEGAQPVVVDIHINLTKGENILSLIAIKSMEQIKEQEPTWEHGIARDITFIVTKECQLACKYCYLVGKNSKERMNFDVAKKAIDYILSNPKLFSEKSVIFDFIGGEPFLEIDLIDKICDYIKFSLYQMDHIWFNSYRFNFSTNGLMYHDPRVQKFIQKNRQHLSIGITIDGTQQKHDLNRVYKNGHGSYDDVVRNIPLWLEQFPGASTKVTISSNDIPYIKESVLHLYRLGISEVNINCVFENVWKKGDDLLFENQLIELANEIINKDLYKNYTCSFFQKNIGHPLNPTLQNENWCGAGRMLAIDAQGNFYPCTRFAQYSLREKPAIIIGNINDGINTNRLRPFLSLDRCTQSSPECINCDVAEGCAWCQGENYDAADSNTIYQRSTAICKMHKARVRANNYYWNRLNFKLKNQ